MHEIGNSAYDAYDFIFRVALPLAAFCAMLGFAVWANIHCWNTPIAERVGVCALLN